MQHKSVVDLHELIDFVLLETNEALKRRRLLSSAAHAMDHVTLLLFADEENVEHFNLQIKVAKRVISMVTFGLVLMPPFQLTSH